MLERILYVSRAASGTELSDVFDIGRVSRLRNAASGLSGCLVYVDGWIVQALEGPAPALCGIYTGILRDPRHMRISLRSRERIFYRFFGEPGLTLRTGPSLNPAVLERFDYRFGFPVDSFPADVLLEFLTEACRPAGLAARDDGQAMASAGIRRQA